jgi:diguanylate cyclase (GGDEF)-like protein/PAS domain S-box-containing protein
MATRKKRAPSIRGKKRTQPVLTSLSSDWYWEQDATLRFTRIDVQTGMPGEQELARRNLGRRPWETGVSVEAGWEAHRALLKARAPFREVLMWRDFDDGSRRYISASGEPVFDARGRFTGYRGVGRDITAHKRGEQLLRLQHKVTRGLAEAPVPADGVGSALRAVCEAEGWDCGELWRLDEGPGVMRRFAYWVKPGDAAGERYAALSGGHAFHRGEGLLGTAWQSAEPLWIPDVLVDARTARKPLAEETGLRAALLCPIRIGGAVAGMLGFACRKIRPPDDALLGALAALATQLGLYLRRADTEARLRESESRFRRTFELAGSGIAHVGLDGRFVRVNRRLCEMLGYAESELVGRTVKELSHPEDKDASDAQRERLLSGAIDAMRLEKRFLHRDGSVVWVGLVVALERDSAGQPLHAISILEDVSARKAAEAAVRESEARFRRLTELSSDWFWEQDAEYRFTRLEGRNLKGGERRSQDVIGTRCWDGDLEVEGGWDSYRALLEARKPFHDVLMWRRLPDGRMRYVRISGEPVIDAAGRFSGYRGVGRDVSEQKHAEEMLRESEERFRRTFELAAVGVAHIGADRRFQRVNPRLCEMLGYSEQELVGRRGRDISYPDDIDLMNSMRPRLYAGEVDSVRGEKRYLRKDGSLVWVAFTLALERDARGAPRYEIAVYDDITARKAAEAAVRESEARFRSLANLSSDWFWEQDAEYRFTRLEGRFVAGGDTSLRARLIGTRRWESGLAVEGGWEAHRALLEARRPYQDVLMWRRMSDGSLRYVSVSGEPVLDPDGRFAGYRGVGRDVTAQKRGEQLLRLEHQVARALADAEDAASGMVAVMRAVCESEGWGCGRYFGAAEDGEQVVYRYGWTAPGSPFEVFLRQSQGMSYRRGQGLAGVAWQTGEPVWSVDTTQDPRVLAKKLIVEGARGAFVFGVVAEGRAIGVLSFTSQEVRQPDERLLQASRVIGAQVGQFLRRMQAEEDRGRFRLAMDGSADMILLIDRRSMRYIDVNSTACRLLGYSREELLSMGPQDVLDASREELERAYDALIAHTLGVGVMNGQYRCKDGSALPFESTRRVLRSGGRAIIVAISRDIRERIAAEKALRQSEARFRSLTEMSSDFFWETDAQHRFTDVVHGPSYAGKIGRLTGKAAWDFPSTHPDEAGWAALRAKIDAHEPFRDFEFGRPWRDGGTRFFSVSGEPHFAEDGAFVGYRGVGREITDMVLARERIASLAYHDPLTGLANRTSLAPALEQAVERTKRRGTRLAGVFLDLDGFKQVNDQYGHDAGDRLLVEAARRLRAALRSSDPVARLGGDEFFVVLEDLPDNAPAERVARKLLEAISPPYEVGGGKQARVSASIGISVYPDDAGDAVTLIKHADTAMYAAKQAGKNAYRFFTAGPAANDPKPAVEKKIS